MNMLVTGLYLLGATAVTAALALTCRRTRRIDGYYGGGLAGAVGFIGSAITYFRLRGFISIIGSIFSFKPRGVMRAIFAAAVDIAEGAR